MKRIKLAWLELQLWWVESELAGIWKDREMLNQEENDLTIRLYALKRRIVENT